LATRKRSPCRGVRAECDETGAILILALVFVLLISVSIVALLTVGGNSLLVSSQLRTQRSIEYAADGATDAAVQAVRYSYNTYTTAADCLPESVASMTISGIAVTVDCSGTGPALSSQTRIVTFYACQQTACTSSNAIVTAQVTFDDYSATGAYSCSSASVTTCGTGMTINSWTVDATNF
jgi:hypothetical protein